MTPISRKEARAAGLTRYFNGVPGSRGHVAERLVSSCRCIDHSDHNSRPDGTVDVLLRNLFLAGWLPLSVSGIGTFPNSADGMGGGRSSASHADIAGPVKRVTKKKPWYSASTRACPPWWLWVAGTAAMRLNGIAWQHEPAAPSYCGKTLQGITPPSRRAAQRKSSGTLEEGCWG
jgi:hypothetical protein